MLISCYHPHFAIILIYFAYGPTGSEMFSDVQRLILNLDLMTFIQHSKKCEPIIAPRAWQVVRIRRLGVLLLRRGSLDAATEVLYRYQ